MQMTCGQSFMMKSMLCSMTTKLPPCDLVELDQQLAQLVDEAGVDARARLVEQHEPRRRHERHRDVDQLLLAVGQACRPADARRASGGTARSSRRRAGRARRPAWRIRREASEPLNSCAGDDQVVAHRQLARTPAASGTSGPTPRRDNSSGDMPVMSSPQNSTLPGGRLDLPEDAVEQRRLARAVGPDDADDLAGADVEG